MKFEIYSKTGCAYCEQAKKLLEEKGVHYIEYGVGSGISREAFFEKFPGVKTVPQIVVDGHHVGGYENFIEWIKENDVHP